MSEDFMRAVEDGIKLSKRLYFGKDRSVAPPKPPPPMSKSPQSYLPSSPMVYAVIHNPAIVDNPDIPSYQPHVHGRCDPPALIPLQMNGVTLEVDSHLDTAFVRVSGSWRVHCVMASKICDCRIAIPLGDQGSILGVEVELPRKHLCSQLSAMDEKEHKEVLEAEDGGYLKPDLFTFTIPQVDGGTNFSMKISWSQKLVYDEGDFTLSVPFSFPEYVVPAGKKIPKKEKIHLSLNLGERTEVLCRNTSHPLKEQSRRAGKFSFLYESEVLAWSSIDFCFSYTVPVSHIFGHVLVQSPSVDDIDQRDMFCVHIFPGSQQKKKVFPRKIVFVVDISGSMRGKLLEDTKTALSSALSQLHHGDSFNIIAFNERTFCFSSSIVLATEKVIEDAISWISINFVAGDGTNISLALNQALELLVDTHDSLPIIFLVTDGSVQDERQICHDAESRLSKWGSTRPRIHTFGIGRFCNHYFLRMLSIIGRGQYDAAYDADSVESRLSKMFNSASSTLLANLAIDTSEKFDEVEVYPNYIPDLSFETPLFISGRCRGRFPEAIGVGGILCDKTSYSIELKAQKAKNTSLDKVLALQQINTYTAQAWLSEDKELMRKVVELSVRTGIISEYTQMLLVEKESPEDLAELGRKEVSSKSKAKKGDPGGAVKRIALRNLGIGFGNLKATAENIVPGAEDDRQAEAAEIIIKAASNFCGRLWGWCCCMCCIEACSKMNNQCAIVLTQACGALACLGCLECCSDVCCSGNDGS